MQCSACARSPRSEGRYAGEHPSAGRSRRARLMSGYAVIIEGGGEPVPAPTTAAVRLVDVA